MYPKIATCQPNIPSSVLTGVSHLGAHQNFRRRDWPRWQSKLNYNPPHLGTSKINIDVASSNSAAAIAVVAWDHKGAVLKAWTKKIDAYDPSIAEVEAITWALELVILEQYQSVIL